MLVVVVRLRVQEKDRRRGGTRDIVLTLGFCLDGVQIDEHAQP